MANFSTAFGLCSITDSKGLLGVSGDDDGCAVITLGKSMVIRCQLSDQKQLNSWSTALSKLTSKVVWDGIGKNYVGVFDNVYIKQWTKLDPSLEKAKKCKFKNEIHEILLFSKGNILKRPKLVVLFKNGSVRDLESALSNSKEHMKEVILPQETIELADIIVDSDIKYLIMVTRFENKYRQCYCVQLQEDNFMVTNSVKKIKIRRVGSSLLGFVVSTGEKGNSLLTLWSDGCLFTLGLPLETEKPEVGKYMGAINMISKKSEASIQPVRGERIAIYGADPSEEGAVLGIYNVKFGVIQAMTSFKMFSKPPRMWLIENNLVTVMGQRLVCVPFNLQTETLSALVGSRALHADLKTPSEICTIIPTAVWVTTERGEEEEEEEEETERKEKTTYPEKIREQLETFSSEGWSEYGICQALMTHMIETEDIATLTWCLCNFTDIPEIYLVKMIQMALRKSSEVPDSSAGGPEEPTETDVFLNKILTTPVDNGILLNNLREFFTFEDCLSLVRYLNQLFSEEGKKGDVHVEKSYNVFDWTMTLLDAFYQQLILCRDSKVLKLMTVLKERIEENVLNVNDLQKIMPSIMRLKRGKKVGNKIGHNKSYFLERIRLYK